jgi:2Fe-2S ferredoxin
MCGFRQLVGRLMARITYIEHDGTEHQVEVKPGLTVMEGAIQNLVPGIEAECGGGCACATCQCYVDAGWADHFPPADAMETDMLSFAPYLLPESRLSCQLKVSKETDGLIVSLPESQY